MLREVKTHSNLEHDNIVRYKTTWKGSPHPDEQEIINHLKLAKFPDQVPDQDSDSSIDLGSDASSDEDSESEKQDQNPKEKEKKEKECLYIALELCEGGTLEDKLNSSKSRTVVPLQILKQMCSAVAYIHDQGLIHRDLKPDNIFIQEDTIKIADFGLVTNKGKHSTNMVGTVLYMAPEVTAEKGDYDNKVDIYSLGLIFLELLVPFGNKDLLEKVKERGDKVPFKNSSFLQFMAEWLKDKINSKSKWTTEAEVIIEELKKIPW